MVKHLLLFFNTDSTIDDKDTVMCDTLALNLYYNCNDSAVRCARAGQ